MNRSMEDLNESDIQFLYEMLKERTNLPNINISHKKLPTYEEHKKFIESQPWQECWILFYNGGRIGYCYLTKSAPNYLGNEIGIYITKNMQKQGHGTFYLQKFLDHIKKFYKPPFYVNTHPNNIIMQKFIKKIGFKQLQLTWRLDDTILGK